MPSDDGASGSLPLLFNVSSALVLCNESAELTTAVNETDDNPIPHFNQLSLVRTIVLSTMFVVAFVGNVATLTRMYRMRRRRSTINLLITHLATADLIVTFFCNVTDAVWTATVQWLAGNAACKLIKFLQVPRVRCHSYSTRLRTFLCFAAVLVTNYSLNFLSYFRHFHVHAWLPESIHLL